MLELEPAAGPAYAFTAGGSETRPRKRPGPGAGDDCVQRGRHHQVIGAISTGSAPGPALTWANVAAARLSRQRPGRRNPGRPVSVTHGRGHEQALERAAEMRVGRCMFSTRNA